jgi:hypothetical protein
MSTEGGIFYLHFHKDAYVAAVSGRGITIVIVRGLKQVGDALGGCNVVHKLFNFIL